MYSFARKVKEEVVFNEFDFMSKKAMLFAILKLNGSLSLSKEGLVIIIRTENAKIASKIHKMLKDVYNPRIEFVVTRKMKLNKNNIYTIKVDKAKEILDDLSLLRNDSFKEEIIKRIIYNDETKRAFLAGAFLARGSVNSPNTSNYHLEIACDNEDYASFLNQLMDSFGLNSKSTKRRNKYIVYLKSAEKIGDFLRAIGTSKSVMEFEGTRINRSMNNTINRWNNCDIANEVKAFATARQQIENIKVIEMFMGLDMLDEKTKTIALLRKDNPEMSLIKLCDEYYNLTGQTISKSGLHHRFKKIEEQAKKLLALESS